MDKEHKEYLDRLRESGKVNMFGASHYLREKFGLERKEAKEIVLDWIKTFRPE